MPGYARSSQVTDLGTFYGFKYDPITAKLTVDKVNDGQTVVRLPLDNKLPSASETFRSSNEDYVEWSFTTNKFSFNWDETDSSHLVVEVR